MNNRLLLWLLICCANAAQGQAVYLSDASNDLYRFDPLSCHTTKVCRMRLDATPGLGVIYDIATHPKGALYALEDGGRLFRVDTVSGQLSVVLELERKGRWNALHIDTAGVFYLARTTDTPQQGDLWIYIPEDNYLLRRGALRRPSGDLCKFGYFLVMAGTARQISDVSSQNNLTHSSLLDYQDQVEGQIDAIFPYEDGCRGTQLMGISGDGVAYRLDLHKKTVKKLCQLPLQVTGAAASPYAGLLPRIPLNVEQLETTEASCKSANGSLQARVSGGAPPLTFSVNNENAQTDSLFRALPAGHYQLLVRDALGCTETDTVSVKALRTFDWSDIKIEASDCARANGTLSVGVSDLSGGKPVVSFVINDKPANETGRFEGLSAGRHTLTASDTSGCALSREVFIPANCPVYIPNVFSPEATAADNRVFRINAGALSPVQVLVYRVYDRWGARVFENRNFPADASEAVWWDGRGSAAGSYLYYIEVLLPDQTMARFSGTVTLIR